LEIDGLAKSFGRVAAVDHVSLTVAPGEFLTILGPSGSGKTTLLKLVAGFEMADRGAIRVEGEDISDLDPSVRDIGMVFQNYALFPHMTVARNVAYPLAMRGVAKAEIARRVGDVLSLVELADYGERKPSQLSGGQQQRVALARAVVFHPRLLLLDEPFGALDRKLREQMQLEVRRLQQRLGLTTIFITHDQEEALVMSDRIAVMDKGRIQQIGTPQEIYEAPASAFVANFIGESNLLAGRLEVEGEQGVLVLDSGARVRVGGPHVSPHDGPRPTGLPPQARQKVLVLIRPERFIDLGNGVGPEQINRIKGEVIESAYTGGTDRYRIRSELGVEIVARLTAGPGRTRYQAGDAIEIGFEPSDAMIVEGR
ncbi:MAG: ABC transporter ATP-binding protein, partial [Proteobacteria bacterium]|nr:ABC transporter ATP-binding protein [Pseudomonadota bacterium]